MLRQLAVAMLMPAVAAAQMESIAPGARVRASVPSLFAAPIHATFVKANSDSVWLRGAYGRQGDTVYTGPQLRLAHAELSRLEVFVRRDRAKGAAVGVCFGLAASAFLLTGASQDDGDYAMLGAAFLSAVITPVAAILGAAIGSEQWRQVLPPPARP